MSGVHRHAWTPIYQMGDMEPVAVVCDDCGTAQTLRPDPTEDEWLEATLRLQQIEAELSG